MSVRIAHATDIHWTLKPPLSSLGSKRLLGSLNLYFGGRLHHFPREVQNSLVAHVVDLAPDAVLITGDLTGTALHEEFELARAGLQPILDAFPALILGGNHDVYTRGAKREGRLAQYFGDWMGGGPDDVARMDVNGLTILGLDPNRPHPILSSGIVPELQLDQLAALLTNGELTDREILLGLHYPVLDRRGAVYDNLNHGLRNARALIDLLDAAPVIPNAIVHGHEHHGFHVDLPIGDRSVPIYNPGSSGYAFMPKKRRSAAMNLYTFDAGSVTVDRYIYDGATFQPEEGGSYATGR